MIKKEGKKWLVKDSSGEKTLGTHSSRKKALAQLRAIEASKAGYSDGGRVKLLKQLLKDSKNGR